MIRYLLGRFLMRRAERTDPDARAISFTRGLVLGALVGAAIAGSSLWKRRER